MTQKKNRTALVAFKIEAELADLLNQLPNKSEFIRRAIAAQIGTACPLCSGKGTVPRSMHDFHGDHREQSPSFLPRMRRSRGHPQRN